MAIAPYSQLLSKAGKRQKEALDLLADQTKYPTVAPRDMTGLKECADEVQRQLEKYGYKVTQFGKPATVYAEKDVGAKKTLMCYHHYDVQPEGDHGLWKSSPWKLTIRDGRAFGRGAADDKGPCAGSMVGLDLIEDFLGESPVNAKFVIEGEEEWSSEVLAKFARKYPKRMKADGCVWEVLSATPDSTGEVKAGMKGDISIQLDVGGTPRYPVTDAHSGYAGAVPSAPWRLVHALKTLRDEKDRITIDGLMKLVAPPSKDDMKALRAYKGDIEQSIRDSYEISKFINENKGVKLLSALFLEPTLSINGLEGGCRGEEMMTIVPSKATAKLDLRLVPNMRSDECVRLLRKHLDRRGFTDVRVKVTAGYEAAKTPVTDPFVRLVHKASTEVSSPAPANLLPMMAGTGPAYLFTPHTPIAVGYSYADSEKTNEHAPNENIPIASMKNNIAFVATVAERMGSSR
jgi:acetylornithine deacetylase/succinyl-diaminopimelate desuccinylase-like protein